MCILNLNVFRTHHNRTGIMAFSLTNRSPSHHTPFHHEHFEQKHRPFTLQTGTSSTIQREEWWPAGVQKEENSAEGTLEILYHLEWSLPHRLVSQTRWKIWFPQTCLRRSGGLLRRRIPRQLRRVASKGHFEGLP